MLITIGKLNRSSNEMRIKRNKNQKQKQTVKDKGRKRGREIEERKKRLLQMTKKR